MWKRGVMPDVAAEAVLSEPVAMGKRNGRVAASNAFMNFAASAASFTSLVALR